MTAGELHRTNEFADVPVMVLGRTLLALASERLAFYRADNGKLRFSADPAYGKCTTPAQDNLNQLSNGLGALSKLGQSDAKSDLVWKMAAAGSTAFPETSGAKIELLTKADFDGKRYSGDGYSFAFPNGAVVESDSGKKYAAELRDKTRGDRIRMSVTGRQIGDWLSKETGELLSHTFLLSVQSKLGGAGEIVSWEHNGLRMYGLLCNPKSFVLIPLPESSINLDIDWSFTGKLPSKADALQFMKDWTASFRYSGQKAFYAAKPLHVPEVLDQPHVDAVIEELQLRLNDLVRQLSLVRNLRETENTEAPLTQRLMAVRKKLRPISEKVDELLVEGLDLLDHCAVTAEPEDPQWKLLNRAMANVVKLAELCAVEVKLSPGNIGPYNSAADIVMSSGSEGVYVVREYPANTRRLLERFPGAVLRQLGWVESVQAELRDKYAALARHLDAQEPSGGETADFKLEGSTLAAYFGSAKQVVIPDHVQTISSYAFKGCQELETVVLGKRVTSIGFFAFDDCPNLKTITINDELKHIQGLLTGFSGKNKVKLIVHEGSFAQKYAKENGYPTEVIQEDDTLLLTFQNGERDRFRALYLPRPDGFMSSVSHKPAFQKVQDADEVKQSWQYAAIPEDTENGFYSAFDAKILIRASVNSHADVPNALKASKDPESMYYGEHAHEEFRTCKADHGNIIAKYDRVGEGPEESTKRYRYVVLVYHDDCMDAFSFDMIGDINYRQQEAAVEAWASKIVREKTVRDEAERKRREEERKREEEQRRQEEQEKLRRKKLLEEKRPAAKAEADAVRPAYERAASMIACSFHHAVAVKADRTVVAIGDNNFGQCNVAGWRNIVAVAADTSGTVKYAGYTGHGANKCTRWKNIREIVMSGDCVYGLTGDGRVLATAETQTGVKVSTAPDVTTWSRIRTIRGSDGVILGIREDGTTEAVYRNYYTRCEPTPLNRMTDVEDVGLGTSGYGVVLLKDGTCSIREKRDGNVDFLNEYLGIVKVYQPHGRSMALLADGTLAYQPLKRGRDSFHDFMRRYNPQNIAALAHSGSTALILTKDGRIFAEGFGRTDNIAEGECFGENFRLFQDLDTLLEEQEAAAEQERIAREEAEERARQKKAEAEERARQKKEEAEAKLRQVKEEAERKRVEKLYADGCANAVKDEKSVGKRLAARKQAHKQLSKVSDYQDAAEYLPKLEAEIEELSKEHTAKTKKTVKRVCILVVVLALLVGGAFAVYHVVLPGARYNEAVEAMDNGDFETAYFTLLSLEEFNKDLNTYKDCDVRVAQAGCGYAIELAEAGRFEEALDMAKQYSYFAEGPDALAQCRYLYGVSLFEAGEFEAAIGQLKQCDGVDGAQRALDDSYRAYAEALFEKQNYAKAFQMHEKVSGYDAENDDLRDALLSRCEEALAESEYTSALEWLELVKGYKNADELLMRAKYLYVCDHRTADDTTTYAYLTELAEVEYEDAAAIYQELYAWSIKITAFNHSILDAETSVKSLTRNQAFLVHVVVSGGEPGGTTSFRFAVDWPGGGSDSQEMKNVKAGAWYQSLTCYGSGTLKVTLYDLDGNKLDSKSIRVNN